MTDKKLKEHIDKFVNEISKDKDYVILCELYNNTNDYGKEEISKSIREKTP
jgi:hypothetical protein